MFSLVSALLIPGGITIQDLSIPGNLPIWSFTITTTSCTNTSLPTTIKVQQAPNTAGVYVHPPKWDVVNTAMIQDTQVTSMGQLQMLNLTVIKGNDWQVRSIFEYPR